MTFPRVIDKLCECLSEPDVDCLFIIGTDSHQYQESITFTSVIIMHRIGKGARYFYLKRKEVKHYGIQEKMFTEASMSLECAQSVVDCLRARGMQSDNLQLEIHVDVGNKGKTREVIKAVCGMVHGCGFTVVAKPDSWGASKVADRYTKHQ